MLSNLKFHEVIPGLRYYETTDVASIPESLGMSLRVPTSEVPSEDFRTKASDAYRTYVLKVGRRTHEPRGGPWN